MLVTRRSFNFPIAVWLFHIVASAIDAPGQAEAVGPTCTPVGGLICQDTTWTADASPYCATQSIIIGCGKSLTIEPGVEVRFPRQPFGLAIGSGAFGAGTLIARGTAGAPIVFTSGEPDPQPGDWVGMNFTYQAADAAFDQDGNYTDGSILEHVVVEYAGGGGADGAVAVNDSSPYFSRCTVRQNASTGVFVQAVGDDEGPIRIEKCMVMGNSAPSYFVGGIYVFSSYYATLTGNTITGNSAVVGGVVIDNTPTATLTGNTISANTGSGIYVLNSNSATLTGNTITGNNTPYVGGGIAVASSGYATLTGNTITGNASNRGGGIYLYSSSSATLNGNTITGNSAAGDGGGIYLYVNYYSAITGNTIVRNSAGGQGGALYVLSSDSATLTDSSLVGNVSTRPEGGAGGIFVDHSPRFSLTADAAAPVTLLDNRPFDLWNNNAFGPAENDIDARNVWWGTTDSEEIEERIWDCFNNLTLACVLPTPWMTTGAMDFTGDGRILLDDASGFVDCLSGPGAIIEPSCAPGDLDRDGDVDLFDFAAFQTVVRLNSQP